ncbi:MAG: hypothetical protein JSS14_13470 [Proteobacteria bacterium]|nr:hypothetical protein [Pseudomonadota bacterium]
MKHLCPTCKQLGTTGWAKRWSSRGSPATCEHCGGLSHVISSTSNGICVGNLLAFVIGAVVGAAMGAWWVIALFGLGAAIAFNAFAWSRAEMFPISQDSAKSARAANWFVEVIGLLLLLFS